MTRNPPLAALLVPFQRPGQRVPAFPGQDRAELARVASALARREQVQRLDQQHQEVSDR